MHAQAGGVEIAVDNDIVSVDVDPLADDRPAAGSIRIILGEYSLTTAESKEPVAGFRVIRVGSFLGCAVVSFLDCFRGWDSFCVVHVSYFPERYEVSCLDNRYGF